MVFHRTCLSASTLSLVDTTITRPDTRPQMRPALLSCKFRRRLCVHVRERVCACMCVCACVSLSVVIAAPLTRFGRTMGRMHYDSEPLKFGTLVMSHSLIRSLVCSALLDSLARRCVRSLARSLTRSRARRTMECFCPIFNVS